MREGFLNINKPRGLTSFGVVREVRKIFNIKKVGHAGNLDPDATGVLVIGIGKATRFLPYITDLEKEYIARIQLGILTDTLDRTGEILKRKDVPKLDEERVKEVLKHFEGEIMQSPPPYSAVRIEGRRLYDLAREGVLVNPKPKRVKVYSIELLDIGEDYLTLKVIAGKGTYIRSLARDIAEKLGTVGIVGDLKRTRVGHFRVEDSLSLDYPELREKIMPIDEGLKHLPEVVLKERAAYYFRNGNRVPPAGILRRSPKARSFEFIRVYDETNHFIGIGYLKWDGIYPKKVLPT